MPPAPLRFVQRLANKAGLITYERHVLEPYVAARRAALGQAATGPTRFLVRVDEFPHYLAGDEPQRYGIETARRFHSTLADAGVCYLMAIVPNVSSEPLDPAARGDRPLNDAEIELLHEMSRSGTAFALHGYNHRTRYASPRRHSELCGLSRGELAAMLDRGLAQLAEVSVTPRVFVPPFNRFDADQYDVLAERFDVVCGGPESIRLLGFQRGPQWRGEAVYLPCYAPLYGSAKECIPAVEQLIAQQSGLWIPVVLHVGWESDDWSGLERFARLIAPYAASWDDFIAAVDASSLRSELRSLAAAA